MQNFSSMQTWFFSIIAALAVMGLAKAWMNFKAKYTEKVATKNSEKSS